MADQHPINDALLGKFLAGETNPAESARVRQWLAGRSTDPSGSTDQDDFARFERIWDAAEPTPAPVDTNAAWKTVRQKMYASGERAADHPDPIVRPLPVKRHEPVWYGPLLRIAAMLTLVTGMGWLYYQLQFIGKDHPASQFVTLTTNEQKISKTLPDGTTVFLNRHSVLRYPTAFAKNQRDVSLMGEAFFDVTPDATRPFRIQARRSVVQVVGTSFTVRAYDANVSVAVRTGKVRFSGHRNSVLLTRNQEATFEASADTIRQTLLVSPNVFAYKTGLLVFNNEPLRDVVQAINQVYNADVRLATTQLGNCHLTTRFDRIPLDVVLTITAETLGLRVRREGKRIILSGDGCQ